MQMKLVVRMGDACSSYLLLLVLGVYNGAVPTARGLGVGITTLKILG